MRRVRFILIGGLMSVVALTGVMLLGGFNTASAESPTTFRITLTNLADPPTPISPGALVGHCEEGAFWSRNAKASAELELIAEVGNPGAALAVSQPDSLDGAIFVQERHAIGEVGPGQSITVDVELDYACKLSTAHMLVHSNDTFVGVNSIGLVDPDSALPLELVELELRAYDAGTEMNTDPGSGFEGGQPDPSRGAANLDNGVATDDNISSSTQWPGTQALLTIERVDSDSLERSAGIESDDTAPDTSGDEDTIGFPNGGSGGLARDVQHHASAQTYLLAVVAGIAVVGAGVGLKRLIRQSR